MRLRTMIAEGPCRAEEAVMIVLLHCVEKPFKGQVWTLELRGDAFELSRPECEATERFTVDEAEQRFRFPAEMQSSRQFGISFGERIVPFRVAPADVERLQRIVDQHVLKGGPEAIDAVGSRATRQALLGAGCVIISGLGFALSFLSITTKGYGPHGGTIGLICLLCFGLSMLGKGVYGRRRHARLSRQAIDPAADSPARCTA